jgi:hypothetical protein
MAFHLAWHTKFISASSKPGSEPSYLLIPFDVASNRTLFLKTSIITASGPPNGVIDAFTSQLACLRAPETRDGIIDPDERSLIDQLVANAASARYSIPEILATTSKPLWSRASLSRMARLVLVRSAGVD